MLNLTSVMSLIPFFLVAAYGVLIARRGETYEVRPQERRRDAVITGIALLYTLWLIFAGGLKFLVLSAILYGPGSVLYFGRAANKARVCSSHGRSTGSCSLQPLSGASRASSGSRTDTSRSNAVPASWRRRDPRAATARRCDR